MKNATTAGVPTKWTTVIRGYAPRNAFSPQSSERVGTYKQTPIDSTSKPAAIAEKTTAAF